MASAAPAAKTLQKGETMSGTTRLLNVPKQKASLLAAADEPMKRIQMLSKSKKVAEETESEPDSLLREKIVAEFVGTFFLVLTVGVSVVSGSGLAAVAIGGVLAVQIYTFASVSGGLFNPAVTLAVLLSGRGKLTVRDASVYAGVQLLAGVLGGFCAYFITDKTFAFDWSATPLGGGGTSFVLEAIFTMALCNIVLSAGTSYDAPNQYFGAAIGGSVTFAALALGVWDQGSLNPAVTLGINLARLLSQEEGPSADKWLVFLFAPLVGGVLAAGVFRLTRKMEFDADESNNAQHFLSEKLVAEFVGTFMLVLTVCLAVTGAASLAAVAIGGMLAVQIYTFGSVSGGLFNPAVALAVFISGRGKLDAKSLGPYVMAQCTGGILAALVAWLVTDTTFAFDYSNNSNGPGWGSAAVLEVLFTCVLCSIVLSAGTSFDAPNQYFGFAIGGAVTAAASGLGTFDQGSFNPAVTLGVNLANTFNVERTQSASLADGWVLFLLAPFVGAAVSAGIFYATRSQEYAAVVTKKEKNVQEPSAASNTEAQEQQAVSPPAAADPPASSSSPPQPAAAAAAAAAESTSPAAEHIQEV